MGEYKHLDKPLEQRQAAVNLFVNMAGENLRRKKTITLFFLKSFKIGLKNLANIHLEWSGKIWIETLLVPQDLRN